MGEGALELLPSEIYNLARKICNGDELTTLEAGLIAIWDIDMPALKSAIQLTRVGDAASGNEVSDSDYVMGVYGILYEAREKFEKRHEEQQALIKAIRDSLATIGRDAQNE